MIDSAGENIPIPAITVVNPQSRPPEVDLQTSIQMSSVEVGCLTQPNKTEELFVNIVTPGCSAENVPKFLDPLVTISVNSDEETLQLQIRKIPEVTVVPEIRVLPEIRINSESRVIPDNQPTVKLRENVEENSTE